MAGEDFQAASRPGERGLGKWLVLVGALELCAALYVAVLAYGVILFLRHSSILGRFFNLPPSVGLSYALGALLVFAFIAGLVWHAVGVITARRWARALGLVFAWIWCACLGYLVLNNILIVLADAAAAKPWSDRELLDVQPLVLLVAACLLAGFFGLRGVRSTCERRDPQKRWTDLRPLPVIALVVVLGASVPVLVMSALLGAATLAGQDPAFAGWHLAGTLVQAFLAAAAATLCLGAWRLRPLAWWGAVALLVVQAGYTLGSLLLMGRIPMFLPAALAVEQAAFTTQTTAEQLMAARWATLTVLMALLVMLGRVRRHFKTPPF